MYESKRTQDENIDIFKTVKRLFDLENPNIHQYLLNLGRKLKESYNIYN